MVNPDIDIQFINKNMQPAFRDFLYEFFSTIHQSSEEAPDFEVQTIESIDYSEIIENIVREHNLNQAKSFREALRNYLEDPTDLLLDFTDKVYTGIINYHLISKEREIDFESLPSSDNRLFLDTNILVALLCRTHNSHPVISQACRRARDLGYELYYLPSTAEEMQELINGSKFELSEFRESGGNRDVIESPFVNDYIRQHVKYRDYRSDILNGWRDSLELRGITEFGEELPSSEAAEEIIHQQIERVEGVKGHEGADIKSNSKIQHDANLLAIVGTLRDELDSETITGPFAISYDKTVTAVGNMRDSDSEFGIALHPRSLLDYLLAFSPVEFDQEDRDEVAFSILKSCISFDDPPLTVEEYAKLIRPRTNLEEGDEELLARIFLESPLVDQLEAALERGRGEEADETALDILDDESYLQQLSDEWGLREKMQQAAQTAQEREEEAEEYQQKYQQEREKREMLERIVENTPTINIDVSAEANASAEAIQEFEIELNQFVEVLNKRLDGGIEASEISDPPSDSSNLLDVRDWLNSVAANLASDAATGGASALLPWVQELLSEVDTLI